MKVQSVQNTGTSVITTSTVSETDCNFSSYLNAPKSLDDIFKEASDAYGVSVDLLKAIAKAESNFDPNATSRCGAMGIMQLMPATAKSLGVNDAYDPYQNVMGGAKYISQMLNKYNGNVSYALAAYNAGPNNVAKYGGIPPFKETQNYVAKVTGYLSEGVSAPNVSYSVPATREDTYYQHILDELFSYEDYLKFLDLYMKIQETEQNKEKREQEEADQSPSHYSFQEIKYNPTVLNLISNDTIV